MMVSSSNEIHLQSAFENLLQFLINKVEEKAFESASAKLFDKTAIQGKVRLNKTWNFFTPPLPLRETFYYH